MWYYVRRMTFSINMKKISFALFYLLSFFSASLAATQLGSVSPEQLIARQGDNALVVDIRTEQEWKATGVIPDSHRLQFADADGAFDLEAWLAALEQLKTTPEQVVILVCRSGNRSGKLGQLLSQKLAMKNIFHLGAGISHWIKSKHAVSKVCSAQYPC